MTSYLLRAIAEDELAKLGPKSGIKASVVELPSVAGNDLRIHIEFAMRHSLTHGASDDEVRAKTRELFESLQAYLARYAQTMDADAAVLR